MTARRPDRALGPGHDEFWAWCARSELRIQHCGACGKLSWPVTQACNHCGSGTLDWKRMSGRGTVVSWARFEKDYYRGLLPMPWDTVLVALDDGPLFLANPLGFATGPDCAGKPVKLAFVDCEDSAGAFRLPVFEPNASEP